MERDARLASRHGLHLHRYVYSRGRLHALRTAATTKPAPAVLSSLANSGLLRYRGKRGGRRKQRPIAVICHCSGYSAAWCSQACPPRVNNSQLIHRARGSRSDRLVRRPRGTAHQPQGQHLRASRATNPRPRCLLRPAIESTPATRPPSHAPTLHPPPSMYVINACSIAKPHAL